MEESLAKATMLISKEAMLDCLRLFDRFETLTYAEVQDVVFVGVWDVETQRGLLELLRNAKANGLLLPSEIPNLEIELRQAVAASFHVADKLGGLTGIGSMVFSRPSLTSWKILNPSILSANYTVGQFGYVNGVPRSGKTNLCAVMMESLLQTQVVVTNILLAHPHPVNYRYAQDVPTMLRAVAALPPGTRWTALIDEAGLWVSTKDSMTTRGKALDRLAKVIGKLDGNLVLIDQQESTIPTVVKAFAANHYFCIKPGEVRIDLHGPNVYFTEVVKDFPKTTLAFDTFDISQFTFPKDFKLEALFLAITGLKGQAVKNAMAAFLG